MDVESRIACVYYTLDDYDRRIMHRVKPEYNLTEWSTRCVGRWQGVAASYAAQLVGCVSVWDQHRETVHLFGSTLARDVWLTGLYTPAKRSLNECRVLLRQRNEEQRLQGAREHRLLTLRALHAAAQAFPSLRDDCTTQEIGLRLGVRGVYAGGTAVPQEKFATGQVFEQFGLAPPEVVL